MTERIPWWRSFLPKRKSGGSKDAGSKDASSYVFGPDFDPFALPEKPKEPTPAASKTTPDQSVSSSDPSKNTNLLSDETFDDSLLDSVFNEQTCRRNVKVSRSGRFKERRRPHQSLPIQENESENVASGKEGMRWWWGGWREYQRLLYKDAWTETEGDRIHEGASDFWGMHLGSDEEEHSTFSPTQQDYNHIY